MKKIGVLLSVLCVITCSCSVVKQSKVLAKCSFAISGLYDFSIADINLDKVTDINQLNVMDAMKIMAAITNKTAIMTFKVGVNVKNPTNQQAIINKIQWIVDYEGEELLSGCYDEKIVVLPATTTIVKVPVSCDAANFLKGKSIKDVYELYQKLTNKNDTKIPIILKVKPTINNYTFPSYIKLNTNL